MSNLRVLKAESKLEALKRALNFMCMTVHADEENSQPTDGGTTPQPTINYEQLISQARKEEKEKLYPRIKKLEEENAKLVQTGNDNLIKIGDLMKTIEGLNKQIETLKSGNGEETQEVKDLKSQLETLTAENKKLKENSPNEEEIRKQVEKEYEVKLYLNEQTTAHKEEILSSFLSEVQGTTKEEIDASIAKAKEKSLAIKKELGIVDDEGNPVNQQKKPNKPKAEKPDSKPNKPKAVNPTENSGGSDSGFDLDYIKNLDPRSEEYKEFRKSLGLR